MITQNLNKSNAEKIKIMSSLLKMRVLTSLSALLHVTRETVVSSKLQTNPKRRARNGLPLKQSDNQRAKHHLVLILDVFVIKLVERGCLIMEYKSS